MLIKYIQNIQIIAILKTNKDKKTSIITFIVDHIITYKIKNRTGLYSIIRDLWQSIK